MTSGTIYLNVYLTPDGTRAWHGVYTDKAHADRYAEISAMEGHRRVAYYELPWEDHKMVHDSVDLPEPAGN